MDKTSDSYLNQAFEILGKRWNGLIISVLMSGEKRFSDIADLIPQISSRMLAQRLKELEQHGVIERTVYPETPVRILYSLTECGQDLAPALEEIEHWAERWF